MKIQRSRHAGVQASLFLFFTRFSVEDFIDQTVSFSLHCGEIVISLRIFGDLFNRLFGVAGQDFIQQLPSGKNVASLDLDVRYLPEPPGELIYR